MDPAVGQEAPVARAVNRVAEREETLAVPAAARVDPAASPAAEWEAAQAVPADLAVEWAARVDPVVSRVAEWVATQAVPADRAAQVVSPGARAAEWVAVPAPVDRAAVQVRAARAPVDRVISPVAWAADQVAQAAQAARAANQVDQAAVWAAQAVLAALAADRVDQADQAASSETSGRNGYRTGRIIPMRPVLYGSPYICQPPAIARRRPSDYALSTSG